MRNSNLADRYARALFELALESNHQDQVFQEIRAFEQVLSRDETIREFLMSPLVKAEDKEKSLEAALKNSPILGETKAFILLLARKGRLSIYADILTALQAKIDESHGVTRGVVRTAAGLGHEDRSGIEKIVSRFTKKQVILSYKEDPQLIGGLIASVGSFTFDDTLTSHLRRLKEEITRRPN